MKLTREDIFSRYCVVADPFTTSAVMLAERSSREEIGVAETHTETQWILVPGVECWERRR